MFLADLTEPQKMAFLHLAYGLIAVDGVLRQDEIAMMEQYKREMAMMIPMDGIQGETEQALAVFETAPVTKKKQIVFELVALACADKDYADLENVLIKKISDALGLNPDFIEKCRAYVMELNGLYERIGRLVGE